MEIFAGKVELIISNTFVFLTIAPTQYKYANSIIEKSPFTVSESSCRTNTINKMAQFPFPSAFLTIKSRTGTKTISQKYAVKYQYVSNETGNKAFTKDMIPG